MLLLQLCVPYAVELLQVEWVTSVCCVLGLSDLLCSRPGDIGGQDNFDGVENCATDPSGYGSTFVFRVVLLVVLAWIMLLLFSSSLIIVSLPLGRVLLSSISNIPITHSIKCNGNVLVDILLLTLGLRLLCLDLYASFIEIFHLDIFHWSKILHRAL
ncbi:hypothetical protein MKW98_015287 [Papaver atlanticum]|uniref:Uncharacterized protein n=1 Tax=Papaver atlanticum TaxID=357466 RepID=A0AAD4T375_9MAGN|nr:hypothetical protein MKW98_015287 [Papaver atlanticum]